MVVIFAIKMSHGVFTVLGFFEELYVYTRKFVSLFVRGRGRERGRRGWCVIFGCQTSFFKRELTVYEFRKRFITRQSQSAQLPATFRS